MFGNSNGYYAPYNMPFYGGNASQAQAQQPAMPQNVPQIMPQPQSNGGINWVSGEAGAKAHLVAPNTTVMLMDSEASVFYLKSADMSGMPLPLRVFDYKERTSNAPVIATENVAEQPMADNSKFATVEALQALQNNFEALAARFEAINKPTRRGKEVVENE
ncbi:MAG: hypothetical protein IJZ72_06345 [Oscillospiraceae bacterium]|nr:hypothetical protein [Oscillospiraceae bacterium]